MTLPRVGRGLPLLLGLGLLASCSASDCNTVRTQLEALVSGPGGGVGGAVLRLQKRGLSAVFLTNGTLHAGSSTPMAADSLIEVASVTKTLVSALVLRKVVEGAVALNTTASSVLGSELPDNVLVVGGVNKTAEITLEQLLLHTSGLPHWWGDLPSKTVSTWYTELGLPPPTSSPLWGQFSSFAVNRFAFENVARRNMESTYPKEKILAPQEILGLMHFYTAYPVGSYHYSDTGYLILGLVVQQLYGKTLDAAVREDLLAPLLGAAPVDSFIRIDMSNSSGPFDRALASGAFPRMSHRYFINANFGRWSPTWTDSSQPAGSLLTHYQNMPDWASGGLVTSAAELGRFWAALMESQASPWGGVKDLMLGSISVPQQRYGYGVENSHTAAEPLLGHLGDGGGTMLYHQEVAITGTNNNNGACADACTHAFADACADARADGYAYACADACADASAHGWAYASAHGWAHASAHAYADASADEWPDA